MNNIEEFAKNNNYKLDYLSKGSPIFQVQDKYTFTSDSIHLAHMVKEEKIETLFDLCAGSGVVGLEVAEMKQVGNLYLVELQKELALCAKETVKLTKTKTKIEVINKSITDLEEYFSLADVIVCNPPYFKVGSGEVNKNISRAMARHEITLTLEDIIKVSHKLLKETGKLYLIHIASRENEIMKLIKNHNFELVEKIELKGKLKRIILELKKLK